MRSILLLSIIIVFSTAGISQYLEPMGGGGFTFNEERIPSLTAEQREAIKVRLNETRKLLVQTGQLKIVRKPNAPSEANFGWPLKASDDYPYFGYHGISNFVDHDPNYPNQLLDYNGGTRTYDRESGYNHKGTDYFLWPFYWLMMDSSYVEIIAMDDGTIIGKDDGNYDRNCAMGSGNWNAVYVQHDNGYTAWYGHMKTNSTITKVVGERVSKGEVLGVVGSSGSSTGPHLHLEIYDADDNLVDPYAGPYNSMNSSSLWENQKPYYDSGVNAAIVHSKAPEFPECPISITPHIAYHLDPGDVAYFVTYYRDLLKDQSTSFRILKPDGSVFNAWNYAMSDPDHYTAAYWYWYFTLPSQNADGVWAFEVTFEGETFTRYFSVGNTVGIEDNQRVVLDYSLQQNFPNPFNPTTQIRYSLAEESFVTITIYNALGEMVDRLVNTTKPRGYHSITFNAADLPGGVYYCRLQTGTFSDTKKIIFLK